MMINGVNQNVVNTQIQPKKLQGGEISALQTKFKKENIDNRELRQFIANLRQKTSRDIVRQVFEIDENEPNWALKLSEKIKNRLSQKYTKEQLNKFSKDINIFDKVQTKYEAVDAILQSWVDFFEADVKNGKLTIGGKCCSYGTPAEYEELKTFFVSLGDGCIYPKHISPLMRSTDLSIAEFKKLYRMHFEQDTKEHRAEVEKQNAEIREYNAKILEKEKQEKFKAIQGESWNKQTYDINKDAKFKYFQKKLEFKQRDIEILDLMQELQKKYGVDKRV